MTNIKYILLGVVCLIILLTTVEYFSEDAKKCPYLIEMATFIILAFTLVVLIFYAAYTHDIALASTANLEELVSYRKKQKIKHRIWVALEQTGNIPPSRTIDALAVELSTEPAELRPVIIEMLESGLIREGPMEGTFSRYKSN